ncbi:uncharacterized protein LOC143286571 isoform X2 [Babylonia areolata]|uniref:uncharacterized protein LOC143286571 isoform X2 n=1 Tax=Babylonia areolata TaxID=304850 RepID=UPI003FD60030
MEEDGIRPQQQPQPELSAKEKFERALAGLPPDPSPLPPVAAPPPPAPALSSFHNGAGQSGAMEKRLQGGPKKQSVVTADLVGDLMMTESAAGLSGGFLEGDDNLDDLEELMEGLQFDIDGFLDLDQFDFDEDVLEKGWRPEDTPQMPQRIPPSSSSSSAVSAKPPLPPVQNPHHSPAPPPPPGRPAQAWRNAADPPLSDIQARVPPLRPPSSVGSGEDSQAATTGRASKKEERLAEEWGFKDTRTAELMMQRANKMKYNAERRRKLSKLDPQQRLRLFRKLEEAKGVRTVRPPPPRVLPRKEYFQAREEEAMQRDYEKQLEYKTKAGRTFEWLHTQVGQYEVSSSRINPGAGRGAGNPLMKTASDSQLSPTLQQQHGYSPVSMEMESAASFASHHHPGRQQRHSLAGEEISLTGHSPLLPPIKTGSAPSQRSRGEREKISWRTEPVEKSGGWGGGKKRGVKK